LLLPIKATLKAIKD